jgi:anti-sigma-K factor RskA
MDKQLEICKEIEELLPAFVLDAVDDSERARVERHLPRCPDCAQLIAAYRPVADALARAAPPVEPPAHLKYRILAATLPKQKPQPAPTASSLGASLANLFGAPAFAAAALALVIALGIWNISLQNQISRQAELNRQMYTELSRQRDLLSALAYAEGQPKQLRGTEIATRASGRLYGAPNETVFALVAFDLPSLPQGKVYQFWLIDPDGGRTSGGTFTVDEQGRGWLIIRAPKPLNQYQGVGITVEPEGGSPKPTTPRVMGTSL